MTKLIKPAAGGLQIIAPAIDLRQVSNIEAWYTIRRVLQRAGEDFHRRLQVMLGAILVISVSLAVSLLILMFSGTSRADILVGWRFTFLCVGAYFALVCSLLLIAGILFGDMANYECGESVGVLHTLSMELRQMAAGLARDQYQYDCDRLLLPAPASSFPSSSSSSLSAQNVPRNCKQFSFTAPSQQAAAAASQLATATSEGLDAVVKSLRSDDELHPLEILGIRADRQLLRVAAAGAASLVGALVSFVTKS